MGKILDELAAEIGVSSVTLTAALGGGEVRGLRAKRAVILAEWDKVVSEHEATVGEIDAAIADAQKREDEALGRI